MSITAISSLVVAPGGKAALPGSGDGSSDTSSPLGFAALLAGQIPPAELAPATAPNLPPPAATLTATLAANPVAATEAPSTDSNLNILATDRTAPAVNDHASSSKTGSDDNAAAVLAALAATPQGAPQGLPVTASQSASAATLSAAVGDKGRDEKTRKASSETDPAIPDPSQVAPYTLPLTQPAMQNSLPASTGSTKPDLSEAVIHTNSGTSNAKKDQPDLPERANLLASHITTASPPIVAPSTASTTPPAENPLALRAESANTAILAGDNAPGNGSNAPAFAGAQAATATAASNAALAARPAEAPVINTPLNTPNWSHDFGSRVVWLAKNDQQVAQININPPQLGPVQISISLNGDQANATFTSPHAEVRQAIQDSLPQLRDMFSAAGISLGQTNVGSQMPSPQREAAHQFANEARSSGENAILSPDSRASSAPAGIPVQRGRGLVDLFA